MKKLFFVIPLLVASFYSQAQSAPTNADRSATSTMGWFEVAVSSGSTNHYTLSYELGSKPFTKSINMSLAVTNPISSALSLSGKIINASGTTLITWSGSVGNKYGHTFDISGLPIGVYHLDIYDYANNKVCTIPFDKPSN